MLGFFVPSAEVTFEDHFDRLSLRGETPPGKNKVRNSKWFRNPDNQALPHHTSFWTNAGLTCSLVAEGGTAFLEGQRVTTLDVRIQGTATQNGTALFNLDDGVPITASQQWTGSAWVAVVSSGGATPTYQFSLEHYSSGDAWQGSSVYPAITPTGTLTRVSASSTATAATAKSTMYVALGVTSGQSYNVVLRLAGPQMEQAAAPTPLLPTGGTWLTKYRWFPSVINSEQQYYPDIIGEGTSQSGGMNPFSVSGSVLTITGDEKPGGALTGQPFISGSLTTYGGFRQKFGYFEIRMRCTMGDGVWPAFWLKPQVDISGRPQAELDVMEYCGTDTPVDRSDEYFGSVHHGDGSNSQQYAAVIGATGITQWHLYGMEWTAERIQFYWDRKVPAWSWISDGTSVPYADSLSTDHHVDYYMLLNLALGGGWGGQNAVVDTAALPCLFEIDYIKVWDRLPF